MPPTIVGALIEMCFKKLTIVEVVTVFGGDPEPLNSLHATFREFISKKLLDGEEATVANIPQGIESFIAGIPAMLSEITVSIVVVVVVVVIVVVVLLATSAIESRH